MQLTVAASWLVGCVSAAKSWGANRMDARFPALFLLPLGIFIPGLQKWVVDLSSRDCIPSPDSPH